MMFRVAAVFMAIQLVQYHSHGFQLQTAQVTRTIVTPYSNNQSGWMDTIITRAKAWPSAQTVLQVSRSSTSKSSNTDASEDEDDDIDEDEDDDDDDLLGGDLSTGLTPEASQLPSATLPASLPTDSVSKFRKLKDIMWIREAVEDVTAAEFACSVEGSSEGEKDASLRRKRKRAVDYEKMLSNLDRRLRDMIPDAAGTLAANKDATSNGEEAWTLDPSRGMGRFAFEPEDREELLRQVIKTRQGLVEIIKGHTDQALDDDASDGFGFELPDLADIRVDIPKEGGDASSSLTGGPKLYVRDDGTVDWEGALQDRAALRKFGGAVWARINGQTFGELQDDNKDETTKESNQGNKQNGTVDAHGEKPAVTAKIEETPAIREARDELARLQEDLKRETKAHKELLSSGILEGQAVANVRLASLDPELRTKIRLSAETLNTLERRVSHQSLVYDLERIYTYLATELGNPSTKGYVPLQDRLNVAEYGLLEGQVENCSRELNEKGTLDADILSVISEQMTDFKRRLGVDYYVTGLTYDREAIQAWLSDILRKTKNGLMFYVKGCRLFWNDLVYCSSLIARAAQGYTLKPREVRTLRRTFKDIITFIPVIIILIIPLSPVGHVLVFGAIQRFFPDFFPSCFTEQRQNLLQLYESTEYSEFTINESFQERFTRFLEAVVYLVASKSKEMYNSLSSPRNDTGDSSDETKTTKR